MKYVQKGGSKRFLVLGDSIAERINKKNFASIGNVGNVDYNIDWSNIEKINEFREKFDAIILGEGFDRSVPIISIESIAKLINECLDFYGIFVSMEFPENLKQLNTDLDKNNMKKKAFIYIPNKTGGNTLYYIWGHKDALFKLTSMEQISEDLSNLNENSISTNVFQKEKILPGPIKSVADFVQEYAIPHLSYIYKEFDIESLGEEYKKTNEYRLYIDLINDVDISRFNVKDKIRLLLTLTIYKNNNDVIDTLNIYTKLKTDIKKVLSNTKFKSF